MSPQGLLVLNTTNNDFHLIIFNRKMSIGFRNSRTFLLKVIKQNNFLKMSIGSPESIVLFVLK